MRRRSKVELYERIRRDSRLEGLSIRGLARRHGVHRRMVREALASAVPAERKTPQRTPTVLGPAHRATVRGWLVEDRTAPPKQRHTARRVWQRLVAEQGAVVAESTVRAFVAEVRRELGCGTGLVMVPREFFLTRLPTNVFVYAAFRIKDLRDAAQVMGQQIHFFEVSSESDLDAAFAALVRRQTGGLLIVDDPLFSSHAARLVALTAQHAVPTIHYRREFVSAGGLLSYGIDASDGYRLVGVYTGRILKGAKPTDLPVVQSTKFDLVINAQTARMLGLTVPDKLLATADEVIE
jgi:hypothetical protein